MTSARRRPRFSSTDFSDGTAFLPRLAEAKVLEYCIEVRPREKALESLANLTRLMEASAP